MASPKSKSKVARGDRPSSEATLYEKFRSAGIEPTKVIHRLDGRLTLVWHVDDDDDRFAEVTTPARGRRGHLLVVRDGDRAEASVWMSEPFLVSLVAEKLRGLAARPPRHHRRGS